MLLFDNVVISVLYWIQADYYSSSILKRHSADKHVASLGYNIPVLRQPYFVITSWYDVCNREAGNTGLIVFGLSKARTKSTIMKESLNSDGQQFHQYQQFEQTHPNSDGQQIHQYQQFEQTLQTVMVNKSTNINNSNKHLQTVMVNKSININNSNKHPQTVMVNKSTNINKTNNHISPLHIEHKKITTYESIKSKFWLRTGTNM